MGCSGRRPTGLPPSLQMPFISGTVERCCCEACRGRARASQGLTTPYPGYRPSANSAMPGYPATGQNAKPRNRAIGNCASDNNELGEQETAMDKQVMPANGTNSSEETQISGFNSNIMDYITEVVLVVVIIIVATIAVWVTFFQVVHCLIDKIQQSNNRRLQMAALAFIGILVLAILCTAIQDQYSRHKARKAKMKKHMHTKCKSPKAITHKTCPGQTSHMIWSSSKHDISHTSYLPWKSTCPKKKVEKKKSCCKDHGFWHFHKSKKSGDKSSYIIFWKSAQRTTSFSDKLHNIIFFWRPKRKHGKRWIEVYVWNPEWNKMIKNKLNSIHAPAFFVRRKHHSYQDRIYYWLQEKKYQARKRVKRIRKKVRRWLHPNRHREKCGCKTKFYFWRFLCPLHKLKKEQKNCHLCALRFMRPCDRKKAKKQRRAYKRAKFYSMPAEMKNPPSFAFF